MLSEKIEPLSIVRHEDFGFGYYDALTNILGIRARSAFTEEGFYERTLMHETQHLIQGGSNNEALARGFYQRYGMGYSFEQMGEDNPLDLRVLFECSAEMLAHGRIDSYEYDTYVDGIRLLGLIKVANILSDNEDGTSLEEISYSSDIQKLFDYFQCKNEAEEKEILNMICSMNYYLNLQSVNKYFKERYKEQYSEKLKDSDFRYALYNSMGQTLEKYFYRNFSDNLSGKTVTLEEVFTMLALYEHHLCDLTLGATPETIKDMLYLHQDAQTELFAAIGEKLGMDMQELQSIYDAYYTKSVLDASSISFVSDSETVFLQHLTDDANNTRYRSINQHIIKNFG